MSGIIRSVTSCTDSSNVHWLTTGIDDSTNFTQEQFTIVQNYWSYVANLTGYQSVSINFPNTTTKVTEINFDTKDNALNALPYLKGSTRSESSLAYYNLCQARSSELGISNKNLSGINLVD